MTKKKKTAKVAEPAARAEELREQIRHHEHAYYVLDLPEISDAEFEQMNKSLVEKNRELIRVQSVFYPTMELMIGLAVVIALVTVWTGIVVSYQTNWPLGFFVGIMGAAFFLLGRAYRAAARSLRPRRA